jgi:hypothetical protein
MTAILVFQSKGTETARINTDKQIVAAAGTASLPVLTTTGDVNTGIYFPAADNIGFATGGTIRGRWTTDGLCFGSDTAAANALDDYEEGTWTPTIESEHQYSGNSEHTVYKTWFLCKSWSNLVHFQLYGLVGQFRHTGTGAILTAWCAFHLLQQTYSTFPCFWCTIGYADNVVPDQRTQRRLHS